MSLKIERPNLVKVFASDAAHGNYLPVKFGTNLPVAKDQYQDIANANYEFGLESLEEDLQMKDLNSVLFYQNKLLAYLFQQGVPEFSAYQDYPMGAVVTYKGNLWIATKDIKASVKEPVKPAYDPCNPCSIIEACLSSRVCVEPEYPSKETGWCAFVTKCEYDLKIAELEATDKALQASIGNLDTNIGNNKDEVIEEAVNQIKEYLKTYEGTVTTGNGLQGEGTTASPISIKIDSTGSNALTAGANGLKLDANALKPIATVELVDLFGERIGYALTETERRVS